MAGARARMKSDEELIRRIGAGDARALEVIFERHGSAAFSLAYRICRTRGRAEDVVQETFLLLWRRASSYQPARGSVRTWLLSSVRNRAIDAIQDHSASDCNDVIEDWIVEPIARAELTELAVIQNDENRGLHAALDELPVEQRQVIELAFFDGLTHTQIAQLLDISSPTVKDWMRLGLTELRLLLTAAKAPGEVAARRSSVQRAVVTE